MKPGANSESKDGQKLPDPHFGITKIIFSNPSVEVFNMTSLKIINEAFWDEFLEAETCPICTSSLEDTGRNFKPGHSPFVCVSRFLRHDIITKKGKITDEEITDYIATNIAKINQDRLKKGKDIL